MRPLEKTNYSTTSFSLKNVIQRIPRNLLSRIKASYRTRTPTKTMIAGAQSFKPLNKLVSNTLFYSGLKVCEYTYYRTVRCVRKVLRHTARIDGRHSSSFKWV